MKKPLDKRHAADVIERNYPALTTDEIGVLLDVSGQRVRKLMAEMDLCGDVTLREIRRARKPVAFATHAT